MELEVVLQLEAALKLEVALKLELEELESRRSWSRVEVGGAEFESEESRATAWPPPPATDA